MATDKQASTSRLVREAQRLRTLLVLDDQKREAGERGLPAQNRRLLADHAKQVARRLRLALGQGTGAATGQLAVAMRARVLGEERRTKAEASKEIESSEPIIEVEKGLVREERKREYDHLRKEEQRVSEVEAASYRANVLLPPEDVLNIKLVRADVLRNLEDSRADESRWFSVTSGLGGVVLGMFAQIVMSAQQVAAPYWVMMIVLVVLTILCGAQASRFHKRVKRDKEALEW